MSDLLRDAGENEDDPRRRARWGLLVLALAATLVGSVMIFFAGTSGHNHSGQGGGSGPAPSGTKTSSGSASHTPSHPATTHPATTHPVPTSTANPCPSAAPCAVTGDNGQAAAALNAFRVAHGRAPVPGAATAQAQECALREGSGPSCEPHYSWQPLDTQNGALLIGKIAGRSAGMQWLLDPAMSSFSVGWAYVPGAGGGSGHYECAILKVG